MIRKVDFRKGNGTFIYGIYIMMITLLIALICIEQFSKYNNAFNTQVAADAIADGTAVYMANNEATYEEAMENTNVIKDLLEQYMGIKISNIKIDKDDLENNDLVSVELTANYYESSDIDDFSGYGNSKNNYDITRHSATSFIANHSSEIGQKIADWGLQYVGCKYSMAYRWRNCYKLSNVSKEDSYWDCSSFVWCAMDSVGVPITMATTTAAAEAVWCVNNDIVVSEKYDESIMQPGDILFYEKPHNPEYANAFKRIGHVAIYVGDGMRVHAKGSAYGVVLEGNEYSKDSVVLVARPALLAVDKDKKSN